jgi:hypothetical protein
LEGRGGRSASDLGQAAGMDSPAGVMSSLWNHSIYMKQTAEGQQRAWPTLSAEEIADIMAILQMETENQ